MKIVEVGDDSTAFEPKNEDESELVSMLFEKVTEIMPDESLGDRAGMAMELFVVVKRWAHKNEMTSGEIDPALHTYDAQYTMERVVWVSDDSIDDTVN